MKKETLFIAFSTQKGGVGKTAFTVLVSSYMHYLDKKSVAVIDCDFPQHSIMEQRKRDYELVSTDNYYKRMAFNQFKEIKKKAYPVIGSNPIDAMQAAEKLMAESEEKIDIIFFDLPGTMNSKGVVKTLSEMDYIFAPISADRLVLSSTLNFATVLNENLITVGKSKIRGLYLLWTKVDAREKTILYDVYRDVINDLCLNTLKTVIPDAKRFRREMDQTHRAIFRSTVFPPDKQLLKGSKIEELITEIYQIINS